ncbi:MAG: hypothetical protein PHQ80_02320 [Candidatus ainarchaeum sp.]|nr:hypothetical protein [Candidatus ainarchaeum sp.]MDD5096835.1 hypothetical protein [Candidatus ainarchaeum sp.]
MARKPVVELGEEAPRSLKFGIIVTIAIFWAAFIRTALNEFFVPYLGVSIAVSDLIIAVLATVIGYLILHGYRKIYYRLKKTKLEV